MIFVTVGNEKKSFSRLLSAVESYLSTMELRDSCIIQKGYSDFSSKYAECYDFVSKKDFMFYLQSASVVVTHAGAGTMLTLAKNNVFPVVVPRLERYDEHLNDHQLDIAREFAELGLCDLVLDVGELRSAMARVTSGNKNVKYLSSKNELISSLKTVFSANDSM